MQGKTRDQRPETRGPATDPREAVSGCLSVIVPARNEAERIADTVAALKALQVVGQVIVVDDGSCDNTASVAEKAGADAMIRGSGAGKGQAMEMGIEAATGGFVGFADADLGLSAGEFGRLAQPVLTGEADLAIAVFPRAGRGGGFGTALWVARWGVRRYGGRDLQAPLCGQRVLTRELCGKLLPFARGYGVEVGMDIDALRLGARIVEVPVPMSHRALGRTPAGFLHRGRQLLDIVAALWTRRRRAQ